MVSAEGLMQRFLRELRPKQRIRARTAQIWADSGTSSSPSPLNITVSDSQANGLSTRQSR
jgi:hypothetical protein|tara:strand:- start:230 stop:409 length:180 start_codon:yes stop_codon:yes gene_type:complete